MKKNGFTLVELIGTVLILALMMLIIIPVVSKSMKSGIEDADKKAKANIELAAQNYVADNGYSPCISIDTLVNNGYLEEKPKLPSNSSILNGNVKVTKEITGSVGSKKIKYTYEYDKC